MKHEENWGAEFESSKSRTVDQRWSIFVDFHESVCDSEGVFGKKEDIVSLFSKS